MNSFVDPKKAKLFEDNFTKHGDTPQAVHWGSEASAAIRYQSLIDTVGDLTGLDVLDIGCGLGHLYEYAKDLGQHPNSWTGVEQEASFVKAMKRKFAHDKRFIIKTGNFMELENDPTLIGNLSSRHFHTAALMGTISLVDPKDLQAWLTSLEALDIDCYMIEFLRRGQSTETFHTYDIFETKNLFAEKPYVTKFVYHELPHVFNVYAWPKKPKLEVRRTNAPTTKAPDTDNSTAR